MVQKRKIFFLVDVAILLTIIVGCNGKNPADQATKISTLPAATAPGIIQPAKTEVKPPATTQPTLANLPTLLPTQTEMKKTETLPEVKLESPVAPKTDQPQTMEQLVINNTAFAMDLYRRLTNGNKDNLFYSPFSISTALAMTYAGARGETQSQMEKSLHITPGQADYQVGMAALMQQITSGGGKDFQLNIVNSLWGQKGYPFLPVFLDLLQKNYGSGLREVDFKNDPNQARLDVNQWVSDETKQKIKDLLPPDAVDAATRLILTNAIYFKGVWMVRFPPENTTDQDFHLPDGATVKIPMMNVEKNMSYGEGADYQVLEMGYAGGKQSLLVVLPAAGKFDQVEKQISAEFINNTVQTIKRKNVNVTFPKFKLEIGLKLSDVLKQSGMELAFTDAADFSGMTGDRSLKIQNVIHKAFIAIDENGTEAAASTAVSMGVTAIMPTEPVEFRADRPFIFAIIDKTTGSILLRAFNETGEINRRLLAAAPQTNIYLSPLGDYFFVDEIRFSLKSRLK